MGRHRIRTRDAVMIALIVAMFFIGFISGAAVTIKAVSVMASGFMDVDIDTHMIHEALGRYRNMIQAQYPARLNIKNMSWSNGTPL